MYRRSFFDWITSSNWKIWFLFFTYPLCVGFFVQFVALPYLFPSLHAGNGLMQGGDWLYFHRLAKDLAERIRLGGWHAWELRPEGQTPAGIAAIFYVFFGPRPWVMLPLNALVHAFGGLVLFWIVQDFVKNRKRAFISVLPFVFFPSAMLWYTQIHKDGMFILGNFLFLFGWQKSLCWKEPSGGKRVFLLSLFSIVAGGIFVWIVRPYGLEMLWSLGVVFIFSMFLVVLLWKRSKIFGPKWYVPLLTVVVSLTVLAPFVFLTPAEGEPISIVWYDTPWIPAVVENKFMGIARVREAYYRQYDPGLGGNIDWNVSFHRVSDVMQYIPRALQIGLLAPFPRHWFEQGTSPGGSITRKVAALEMCLIYLALILLVSSILSGKNSVSFWAFLYFSLGIILVYALSVPNLGSLYRTRYGFLMLLVAIGLTNLKNARVSAAQEVSKNV